MLWLLSPLAFANEALLLNITPTNTNAADLSELVMTFDQPVTYKVFTLSNPNRLVIDFANTIYAIGNSNTINFSQTPITDFRHGIQEGINLRMVFDLNQAIEFNSSTLQKGNNYQVILALTGTNVHVASTASTTIPTSNTVVVTPTPTPTPTPTTTTTIASTTTSIPTTVAATTTTTNNTVVTNTANTVTTTDNNTTTDNADDDATAVANNGIDLLAGKKHRFIVIIDAGHGGKDPGTTGPDGTHEKNITLAIAKDLQALVNKQPNMHAVMTRDGDYYVGLRQRLMLARQGKGDVFIAIHADAYKDPYAQGASVFALSLHGATSEAALWLAQKENYSELGGVDLNGIQDQDAQVRSVLIDLSQTATIGASLQLGNDVIKQIGTISPLHRGFVEQAPFMVLKSPDIPSILVETGFLSNPKEVARLRSAAYQQQVAQALMAGIKQYYSQNAPRNVAILTSRG